MDDLFGFGVPESRTSAEAAPVYSSRREMREAEARAAAQPPRESRQTVAPIAAPVAPQPTSRRAAAESSSRREAAQVPARRETAVRPATPARKLGRAEAGALRASAPQVSKKHPISVLVTMAAVVGMFAVAGLPAYALTPTTSGASAEGARSTQADAQTIAVSSQVDALAPIRDGYHASTQADIEQMYKDQLRAEQNALYNASGARALGDDYPWPYELRDYQGGGLSPLNYYYRECVDFVAWRLNRDAGYYSAPFKWVWTTLTPLGGNASQWRYNWEAKGWPTSTTPVAGSVAWFYGNHVAYVKSVNADGTVTIEEYNWGGNGMYGQRTIPAASVPIYLYAPPA